MTITLDYFFYIPEKYYNKFIQVVAYEYEGCVYFANKKFVQNTGSLLYTR